MKKSNKHLIWLVPTIFLVLTTLVYFLTGGEYNLLFIIYGALFLIVVALFTPFVYFTKVSWILNIIFFVVAGVLLYLIFKFKEKKKVKYFLIMLLIALWSFTSFLILGFNY